MAVRMHGDSKLPIRKDLVSLNFQEIKSAVEFSRAHLSHMDNPIINENKLPLELFVDYETLVQPLFKEVKLANQTNRLNK